MKRNSLLFLTVFILLIMTLSGCKKESETLSNNNSVVLHTDIAGDIEKTSSDVDVEVSQTVVEESTPESSTFVSSKDEPAVSTSVQTADNTPSQNINSDTVNNNTTNNTTNNTKVDTDKEEPKLLTYKEYLELSAEKREEYFKTFDSVEDFAKWHKSALEEYKKDDDSIHITGNGSLNLEDYIK